MSEQICHVLTLCLVKSKTLSKSLLVELPIGSAESERSFSCLRHCSTMINERLENLAVLDFQGFDIQLSVDLICQSFT